MKNWYGIKAVSLVFLMSLLVTLGACVTGPGVYHTVKEGETLWRISKTYGVEMQTIAEYNEIYDPNLIYKGQKLFIPGARKTREVKVYPGEKSVGEINVKKGYFGWPTDGLVYSLFGVRWGRMHKGIDISGHSGTPIVAPREGKVSFAGWKGGYGNTVIIEHPDNFKTLYGHLNAIKVKAGDTVKLGDVIGLMGSTGKSTGPHLHFEVHKDGVARNPLFFLP
ncbi:MAG: peptidoglycan DD-metalloendopeptidase family protein [Deltaproteobacteria bacterium]|uniref:Peptidoglycan DD-metalloendopeptidase family protein n=1 Tax=Candidatus Zymogenus saltonus TaxID=2844893 RepID=A0A9D8KI88_9DELT|nr:peptidoglycan DD-metalloendopeptidase family protein [Candidatus Zymogenus saltonus]